MRKLLFRLIVTAVCLASTNGTWAEETSEADSLKSVNDSIVQQLNNQIRELKLQSIMMQEQLERTGKNARQDSIQKALTKARIDSLREITPGAPLVIDDDTLLTLYARKGGILPERRVEQAREQIISQGRRLTMFADTVYVYESEFFSWQNTTRQELAAQYRDIVKAKIEEIHAEYGLQQKLIGLLLVVLIVAGQWLLIKLTNWLYRRWRLRLIRKVMRRSISMKVKDYEVLSTRRKGLLFSVFFRLLRTALIVMQLMITIPLLFTVFPETKTFVYTIFGYLWDPFVDILSAVVDYLPNIFKIAVIVICFRYLVKAIHYLSNEVASGNLKFNGFYADWAHPTYLILRLLLYSFMFVMIWPLLPNSDSEVFQGVSVFIGIIVSLGSTSVIGNLIAGIVMTYMRPFHVGDFIRFGDIEGFVIEKTALVTRLRTRKNEVITIPNSNLMSSQTSNFTFAAQNFGIIVHTKVTIGYDMKHQLIEGLLLDAAKATPLLKKTPQPYVRVTALDDFYVEYEINAFTAHSEKLSDIYSELHQNILDHFHRAGVEIMSPHIFAHRNDLEVQIPQEGKA